jgi:hypothetical protein
VNYGIRYPGLYMVHVNQFRPKYDAFLQESRITSDLELDPESYAASHRQKCSDFILQHCSWSA